MFRSAQRMLNVEVVKYHFVNIFLLKFIRNVNGNGMVQPLLEQYMSVLVRWFGGGRREAIAKVLG